MPASLRFKQLKKEIGAVGKFLLPRKFDPIGTYTDRWYWRARGYRLLVYAQFESYVEDRVMEVAEEAFADWKRSGVASRPLLCLLAFSGQELQVPPESKHPNQTSQKKVWSKRILVDEKLQSAFNALHHAVNTNHGIKEENLLQLLLRVGISADDLDDVWLADLNDYGATRGAAAHKSKVQQPFDPEDEAKKAQRILDIFEVLDEKLNDLLP